MSRCHEETIKCPNCGYETNFIIWESINTVLNPDLKEKVRNDDIFRFGCRRCGYTALVNYPFLYHQMEDKIMIYYTSNRTNKYANQLNKAKELLDNNDFFLEIYKGERHRVVATREEFKEKLQILDAGLDDRVVEMMKLLVASYYFDENPKGTIKEIYFVYSKDEAKFIIKHDDNSWGSNNYIQDMYDDLKESYKDVLDREDNDFIVDANWASNFIDTYHEQIKKDLLGNPIKLWDSQNDLLATHEKPMLTEKEIRSPIDSFRWAYSFNTAKGFFVKSKEKTEEERLEVGKDSSILMAHTFADLLFDDGKSIRKAFENIEVWPTNEYNSLMIFSSLLSKQTFIIDSRGEIFEIPCEIVERGRIRIEREFSNDKRNGCYKINGVNVYYRKRNNEESVKSILAVNKDILNKDFDKFIRKTLKEEMGYLYLTVGDSKCGSLVKHFVSNGMNFEIVPNILNDDDTINIRIPLDEDSVKRKDVQFLCAKYPNDYSVYGLSYESISGGLKLNKRNIYYLPKGKEAISYSIIDTLGMAFEAKDDNDIYRKFTLKIKKLFERADKKQFKNEFSNILLKHPNDIDVNALYVKEHLEYIKELLSCYGKSKDSEVELIDKYGDVNYSKYKLAYEISKKLYTEKINDYENKVIESIAKKGHIIHKGKNESTLFALVIKEYSDAIYQFHSNWLMGLSLDVYIPTLKFAIEYHGQQHYGFNDMYRQEVIENDRIKKLLCQENGVKLIVWEFEEPISKSKLQEKIKNSKETQL